MIYAGIITLVLYMWKIWGAPRTARLPQWAQPIPPVVLGALSAALTALQQGLSGEALWQAIASGGGEFGLMAIGIWHVVKRVPGKSKVLPIVTLACAGQLTSGCAFFQKHSDVIEPIVCDLTPEVREYLKAKASERGAEYGKLAEAVCDGLTEELNRVK